MRQPVRGQGERVFKASILLGLGYRDYIAARTLFRCGMLLQGATLAATAVEKYLKATVAIRGNTLSGHLNKALINSAENLGLFRHIRKDFVEFLAQVYELRYMDALEPGFNITIAELKTLTELDFTVGLIERSFRITREGEQFVSPYLSDKLACNPLLLDSNYLINRMPKETLVRRDQDIYEFRLLTLTDFREATYRSSKVTIESSFKLEGLCPVGGSCSQFKLAYIPLPNQAARPVSILEA